MGWPGHRSPLLGQLGTQKVKAEIGDLYPLIPDPEFKGRRKETQTDSVKSSGNERRHPGWLLSCRLHIFWARTVRCKNPTCAAEVPLFRQLFGCDEKCRIQFL